MMGGMVAALQCSGSHASHKGVSDLACWETLTLLSLKSVVVLYRLVLIRLPLVAMASLMKVSEYLPIDEWWRRR